MKAGSADAGPALAVAPTLERSVADYIAGMTDRFASKEHQRLTGRKLLP
jgi:dGTPase